MKHALSRPLLLRGKVVQPDGAALDRYVLVRDGLIESVSRRRPPLTDEAVLIETGPNDWIFPGLLDLHSHTDKNVMPIWNYKKHHKDFFDNRFRWRKNKDYRRDVRDLFKKAKKQCSKNVIPTFAEIQAVSGGTTVLQEDWDLDQQIGDGENPLLCRGTGDSTDLGLPKKKRIWSVIDFFRPNASYSKPVLQTDFKDKSKVLIEEYARNVSKLQATLIHLAEGRSGYGDPTSGVDPYTRLEFEAFMEHEVMNSASKVRRSALTIIHGCGIDVENEKHISFLRERNISVIWSPVSNLLLYGDTLNIEPLVNGGINVALGSDWSPSGSKHVWDEAKNARYFFEATGSVVSDAQIFQMVTTGAAQCLGISNAGRIEKDCFADFFILRSPIESDDAMEVFFKTEDRDVRAVIIGGRPIYGDRFFLEPFGVDLQDLPRVEGSAVENKAVHLPAVLNIEVEKDINELEDAFKNQGVMRSNLLVSSDIPYQQRISKLRQYMTEIGWDIQKRKRSRARKDQGIKVAPDAVRVWRGFCAEGPKGLDKPAFRKQLGNIFIPCTTQLLPEAGMTAYLPTVLPDDVPVSVPDEIALVFYASQDAYGKSFGHTGARIQGLLHRPVFSFEDPRRSLSGFPILFAGDVEFDQAYHLFEEQVDWYLGSVFNYVASRPESLSGKKWNGQWAKYLMQIQKKPPKDLDAIIVAVSSEYVVYWAHWIRSTAPNDALQQLDQIETTPHLSGVAKRHSVPKDVVSAFDGIPIEGGEIFNLRFIREQN